MESSLTTYEHMQDPFSITISLENNCKREIPATNQTITRVQNNICVLI